MKFHFLFRIFYYFFPLILLFILGAIYPGSIAEGGSDLARKKLVTDFLYVFNINNTVLGLAPVPFSNNGPIAGGFTHIPGDTTIFVLNAGIYRINFSVSSNGQTLPNQFAIFVNGVLEPTTVYGSGGIIQQTIGQTIEQTIGQAIVTLPDNAAITLRNIGFEAVILQNRAARAININASLIIERLL